MARTRILLADDHEEMRNFVTQMLEQEYEIVEAVADGRTFLEAASKLKARFMSPRYLDANHRRHTSRGSIKSEWFKRQSNNVDHQ